MSWHDLAFFDPAVYESLRRTILDSREPNGAELLTSLGLTFAVTLSTEEGGQVRELKKGGSSIHVTPSNVYEYVKRYAELRMIEVCQDQLEVSLNWRVVFYAGSSVYYKSLGNTSIEAYYSGQAQISAL